MAAVVAVNSYGSILPLTFPDPWREVNAEVDIPSSNIFLLWAPPWYPNTLRREAPTLI